MYRIAALLGLLSLEVCNAVQTAELLEKLNIQDIYTTAVEDAAVASADEYHRLLPVPQDAQRVSAVTWASRTDSYVEGEQTEITWGDVWVTLVPEVRDVCCAFSESGINVRMQQLLGLPYEPDKTRWFVEFDVNVTDLFRPCTSPDIYTTECPEEFDTGTTDTYFTNFFAKQVTTAYKAPNGYPWTHIGYTYDWDPETTSEYGASEYVVRQGATVNVTKMYTTEEYCTSSMLDSCASSSPDAPVSLLALSALTASQV